MSTVVSPEEDRALLEGAPAAGAAQATPEEPEEEFYLLPASFQQQRLWFLARLQPESHAYNLYGAVVLRGVLRLEALETAVHRVIERHEVLRTTFTMMEGSVTQLVAPVLRPRLALADLRGVSGRRPRVRHLAGKLVARPFDLFQGPLLRLVLVRTGEQEHVLVHVLHHIITDGVSNEILIRELAAFYGEARGLAPARLPELPVQYGDYARWQREWLQGERLAALVDHWRSSLEGFDGALELPADRPRPPVFGFRGGEVPVAWPEPLVGALRQRAREHGTTLFTATLAAYGALLHRVSGQRRFLLGTPVANRDRLELESLLGFFSNTLAIPFSAEGDPSFSTLLDSLREAVFDAGEHQALPFERLVKALDPEPDPSRPPLVQAVLTLAAQSSAEGGSTGAGGVLAGLEMERFDLPGGSAKFELLLTLAEADGELHGALEYASDLFFPTSVRRLAHQLRTLVEAAVAEPGLPLSRLPLLTAAETHQLLREWPGSEAWPPDSAGESLHGRFAHLAADSPDAPAVSFGDRALSYGELDALSDALAGRLAGAVGPGSRVAVCLERSLEMVVALLATVKAGAAYVPLDPTYPQDRLTYLLEDSGVSAILADAASVGSLPQSDAPVLEVSLQDLSEELSQEPSRAVPALPQVSPQDIAYVIYTSGSTGKPKGVEVTHGNVLRLFEATTHGFRFGASDVWTLFHSYAFDFSVWELWGALLYGGRSVVVPHAVSRSPEDFHRLLAEEGVTVLNQTPSAFRGLQKVAVEEPASALGALRWVVFGGEALDLASLAPWFEHFGDRQPGLVNMYGITETTVHVTYRRILAGDTRDAVASVIGRGIPDLRLYCLDRAGRPVPAGVTGELFVGGAGLARGYLGRPSLTAERFLPDPYSGVSGGRLYRSGDLGRWRPEGELDYQGRADHQVKIRGFRIELGEIESVLAQHPWVSVALVKPWEDRSGSRLAAYLVGEDLPTAEEMGDWLRRRLPEPMIPAFYVPLDAVPLTPTGKVDRRALLEPELERSDLEAPFRPPSNAVEATLASIWSRVLGVEQVGVLDSFFALGGDSIRSVEVLGLAREAGLRLSLEQVFQAPTLGDLAAQVRLDAQGGEAFTGLEELVPPREPFALIAAEDRELLPDGIEDAYPLAKLQEGMFYHQRQLEGEPVYHNVDSWHLRFRWDFTAFQNAWLAIARRHPILRTSFDLGTYSQPLQLVHREARFPIRVFDLQELRAEAQEAEIDRLRRRELARPFDLARPPQMRLHVHRRSEDTLQLTITENHAILDGWSFHVLLEEVMGRYFAALDGAPAPREIPLESLYRDYVFRERQALESRDTGRFWQGRLAGAELGQVPRTAPPRAPGERRVARLEIPLQEALSRRLRELARAQGVPIKSLLLAIHAKVLSFLHGQGDVVTSMPFHGRPATPDGQRVTGLFLNTLPVRLDLGGSEDWRELMSGALRAELEIIPHRFYPLAAIQEARGGEALFETSFLYLDFYVVEELVTGGQLEVMGDGVFIEDTDFTILAIFNHPPGAPSMVLDLQCDRTVMSDTAIESLRRTYLRVLEAVAEDPRSRHGSLPSIAGAARHQVLVEWNDHGVRGALGGSTLHEAFRAQAQATPQASALIFGDTSGEADSEKSWSFAELDRHSDRLGRKLLAAGVRPDGRVGLCLAPGPEAMVAILGVLKAGAAYVPLDPQLPSRRLASMQADAEVSLVVTSAALEERLPGDVSILQAEALLLGHGDGDPDGESPPRWPRISDDHLAYVLFTSGSTGRPKGVAMSHRALVNLMAWQRRRSPQPPPPTLQFASLGFDVSCQEMFSSWLAGGALVLTSEAARKNPQELLQHLRRHRVGRLFLPVVALRQLAEAAEGRMEQLASVGQVMTAGEKLRIDPEIARVFEELPGCTLENQYGPTETHVATAEPVAGPPSQWPALPAIGRPVDNEVAYLADLFLRPVPAATPGEVLLGGAGLARGYLGRPGLTAKRFVPDPFGTVPGGRLYRTGDLARAFLDGRFAYLGRRDQQVKVRGFRVEPGEVEVALKGHPEVVDCAVTTAERGGENRLLAYYQPVSETVPGGAPAQLQGELEAFLAEILPEFMIPSLFVALDSLPVNRNGKIDRRALPAPVWDAPEAVEAPRDPLHELLGEIFREVLGLEKVPADASFFELGGHSLLATRLLARVRRAFGVEIPLRDLFAAPSVRGLAWRIERARGPQPDEVPPVVPVGRDRPLPLSFAQQRLWLLDQLEEGSLGYNIPLGLRLAGELRVASLAASLNEVARRHEVLRTTFETVLEEPGAEAGGGEVPVQAIAAPAPVPLPVLDLGGLDAAGRAREIERLTDREARVAFDLARGPLWRARLLRLEAEDGDGARAGACDHAFLATFHHTVSDGWSLGIFLRELQGLYGAFAEGRPSPLPELTVQYADFAVWQRGWLRDEVLKRQREFWVGALKGAPLVLELPTDRPPGPAVSDRGRVWPLELPLELSRDLAAFARRSGSTLFMVLLSGFEALLQRLCGVRETVLGTPVAGRSRLESEDLLGLFVNTLVLRGDLRDRPGLAELTARTRETVLDAFAHQDFPFEQLVEELEPERNLARSPVFQVMFGLQNEPRAEGGLAGLELGALPLREQTATFDLSVLMEGDAEFLGGGLRYRTDLFDATTIGRLAASFMELLTAAVREPRRPLVQLSLLGAGERLQLVVESNDTGRAAADQGVAERLRFFAAAHPAAVAVEDGEGSLSYRELAARVHRQAGWLRSWDLEPEEPVAVLLDRSAELVIAFLAILEAGGAYLPLEPAYPAERTAFMVRDSGARRVLSRGELAGRLRGSEELEELEVVDLAAAEGFADAGAEGLPPAPAPDRLAYVIYTSGSTGRPKGAMVTHRGMVNHLWAKVEDLELGAGDTLAQTASQCFDISVWQMLTPLMVGGRCLVVEDAVSHEPVALLHRLEEAAVSVFETVPSLLAELLLEIEARRKAGEPAPDLAALRWLIPTGEALPPELCRRWLELYPEIPLVNAYGPTECSDDVTHHLVRSAAALAGAVPIGTPVRNTRLFVVDPWLELLPLGFPGELVVAGEGVGRGYLGDPRKTAAAFLPDPFSGEPGGRLYRTGDRVVLGQDGALVFQERLDHQVKVRGFRIELGEVERVLLEHPEIAEGAVLARRPEGSGAEDLRLVAYGVSAGPPPSTDALRDHLARRLPDYMVPGLFVFLDSLPVTANGKLDRRALPDPPWRTAGAGVRDFADDPILGTLAALWAEVLHLEAVPAGADFFALGGHSLVATQLVSRLRRGLGVEIPLRAVFEASGLEAQAEVVRRALRQGLNHPPPPMELVPRHRELPLSFAQQRLWVLAELEPESTAYNIPLGLRLEGPLDLEALARSLESVVDRHEVLRTRYPARQGVPRQEIQAAATVPLPLVDLQDLPSEERLAAASRLGQREAERPFDLKHGPVLRARAARLGSGDHAFFLTFHHIASDGWSLDLLVRELGALYGAFRRDGGAGAEAPAPVLPDLPVQYADYAHWQREWLSGDVLEAHLSFWRRQLADRPPVLELPADRARPQAQSYRGAAVAVEFDGDLASGLAALGRRRGATPFVTLLAVFEALLFRLTGSWVAVGTPVAGRDRLEIEGLIGFFVNTLLLGSDLRDDPSFEDALERIRRTTLEAYAHQELPFEKLVDELEVERSLSHSPLFQVMLVFEAATRRRPTELADLRVEGLDSQRRSEMFDLTLALVETEVDGAIAGTLSYAADLFDATTILRLGRQFRILAAAAVEAPGAPLTALSLLSPGERHQVVGEWNDTAAALGGEASRTWPLHRWIAEQARRTPAAIAVEIDDDTLSYGELQARAETLAVHLMELGVGPENLVGVALERSLELMVGLLAVLQAGGAYVPLDPGYPRDRLAYMMDDAGLAALLTSEELAELLLPLLPPLPGTPVVLLGPETPSQAPSSVPSRAQPELVPEGLAYVIYTSGSTGRPKGAGNSHRAIVNRLLWMQRTFRLGPEDRVLQKTPISFDVSVWELFWPLMTGARLVLARPGGHRDAAYLARLVERRRVTTAHFVPSMLQLFVTEPGVERCRSLRRVIASGEALPYDLEQRCLKTLPGAGLFNLYGPTEAAVDVSWCRCAPAPRRPVPIGRPIENLRLHVLDPALRPVPPGVAGELFLAGTGLGRGYHRRPALTAQRWLPDPLSPQPGGRLYRTGDRVRTQRDGEMEFLGRLDHQVKIRGFRIELGEIATALLDLEAIEEAVVVARGEAGRQRLAAYLVAAEGAASASVEELRRELLERLPEHMVPAAFRYLDALPLTPNGKLDRRALPEVRVERKDLEHELVAPVTPAEMELAEVWRELLNVESLGREDNFFALGGDSILAIQVVARARRRGLQIQPRQIFEHQSLRELAAVAQRQATVEIAAEQGPVTGETPLLPIQRWFFDRRPAEPDHWNQTLFLAVGGTPLEPGVLAAAAARLEAHHDALRSRFEVRDGVWRQVLDPPTFEASTPPVTRLDLPGIPPRLQRPAMERLAAATQASLNLAAGPLWRAVLFDLGPERRQRLLLVAHHLVVDGVSWRILLEDLEELCRTRKGTAADLPAKTTSIRQWSERLQGRVDAGDLDDEIQIWTSMVEGAVPELAPDHPTGRNLHSPAGEVVVALEKEETRRLLQDAAAAYRTEINDLLLTALLLAHRRQVGGRALRLTLEGHGREDLFPEVDLGRTVGWLTTRFPVLLDSAADTAGDGGLGDVIKAVKERLRAIPNHGIGFGLLRYLHPDAELRRRLAAGEAPPILFNYLGQVEAGAAPEGRLVQALEDPGPVLEPGAQRPSLLEVDSSVSGSRLRLVWQFSLEVFEEATVRRFAEDHLEALRGLVAHCVEDGAGGATPSDFPLAALDQGQLDALGSLFDDELDDEPEEEG